MKKNIVKIICAAAMFILGGCGEEKTSDTLVVGVSADYPPFEFQSNGEVVGFDIDFINEIGKLMQKKVEIKDMPFNSLIPSLNSNKIDIAISGLNATPERAAAVDFSQMYYNNSLALIYKKDRGVVGANNLANKSVGAQLGSTLESWIRKRAEKDNSINVVTLDSNITLIEELKLGRVDAVIIELAQGLEFCLKNPELGYSNIDSSDEGYVIAIKKGSKLIGEINEKIQELKTNGFLHTNTHKWIHNGGESK